MTGAFTSAWKMSAAVLAMIAGGLATAPASAARFPNAVEKRIVVTGNAAASVAALLGLSSSQPSTTLQLGKSDAWAVYLLKQDTKTPLSSGKGPPRYNRVTFSVSPIASLTIQPYWLDLATQLPESKPGYYSFGSPFLSEQSANDGWSQILRRLKGEPGWNANARPQFRRCFVSNEKAEICIAVYGAKDYASNSASDGYQEIVTVRPS